MFCPKCGKADQLPETYCRQCGVFLPDLSKALKRESPPEEHLKANTVLSVLTIIASFTMAILLYTIMGFSETTHPLIYATAGILVAIGGWHIQTLIRNLKLKKQLKRRTPPANTETASPETQPAFQSRSTAKLLNTADFTDAVPASVTENTTKHLAEKPQTRSNR